MSSQLLFLLPILGGLSFVHPTPTVSLSLGTAQPKVGVPFNLSCTLSPPVNSSLTSSAYAVAFKSQPSNYLASYEHGSGTQREPLLWIRPHANKVIQQGGTTQTGSTLSFNLTLTELKSGPQTYLCTLAEKSNSTETSISESAPLLTRIHPVVPEAAFSYTSRLIESEHPEMRLRPYERQPFMKEQNAIFTFICAIDNYSPFAKNEKEYSVRFWSQPKDLIATYLSKPNQVLEFTAKNENTLWSSVSPVVPTGNLTFAIEAVRDTQFRGMVHAYSYCTLGVGTEGSTEYREYKSDSVRMALNWPWTLQNRL